MEFCTIPTWKRTCFLHRNSKFGGDQQIEGVDFFETYAPVVQWNFVLFLHGREPVFYVGIQNLGALEQLHLSSHQLVGTQMHTYFASQSVRN